MALNHDDYHALRNEEIVLRKIRVGILAKCRTILDSTLATEGVQRWQFSRDAMRDPTEFEKEIVHFILEENKDAADQDAVKTAPQSAYDTNVALAIDKLYPVGT